MPLAVHIQPIGCPEAGVMFHAISPLVQVPVVGATTEFQSILRLPLNTVQIPAAGIDTPSWPAGPRAFRLGLAPLLVF